MLSEIRAKQITTTFATAPIYRNRSYCLRFGPSSRGTPMRVDINSLPCATAFELSEDRGNILLPPSYGGAKVEAMTVKRVLYLPNVLELGQSICVTLNGILPSAAILDRWTLDFVKKQLSLSPKANYQGEFEADYCSS